ncbi:MAG: hypothetical protein K8I02_08070 [Candidatus Methylomirabilis sp.]|nr:hypothetical protein [Deltaproteobacteria bacterium]
MRVALRNEAGERLRVEFTSVREFRFEPRGLVNEHLYLDVRSIADRQ